MSITEVARRAGLSVATVSRVFNSPEVVNAQTRSTVLRVAQEVGYVANASARTLRTRSSKVLGVVLPTLTNPVFAECLQGIASQAALRGYAISPCTTEYDHAGEDAATTRLLASGVDALVLVVSNPGDSAALARVRQAGKPYVLAYHHTHEHACVGVDNTGAVRELVLRLAAAGHSRIGMVTGQLRASDRAQQRCRGYALGMQAAGLSPQKDSLALEATDTPYVTVLIATRAGHEKDAGLQAFVKAYQSPEVRQFIDTQFKGAYTAAW